MRRTTASNRWRTQIRAVSATVVAALAAGTALINPASAAPTPTTTYAVAQIINAPAMWNAGFTGKGADIAVIDTGVAPVKGLEGAGKLFHGPDLSLESQVSQQRYLDSYGHGTHMAGIAAGKDAGWTPAKAATVWAGIAPDAKVLSMKVGEQGGAVDISQVVAAIYWVMQHRKDNGLNVRVINLAYGTDANSDWTADILSTAVEAAWRSGIVVVVSAGNTGYGRTDLNNPAQNRLIIAAGATDTRGTLSRSDDIQASFSTTTDGVRAADVYAPGASIAGLRVPGSYLDQTYPGAVEQTRFFRGSGSSQAAAVLAGAASLLIQQRPTATPNQIKYLLKNSCPGGCSGKSVVDLGLAKAAALPSTDAAYQGFPQSAGGEDLSEARGTAVLTYNGVKLPAKGDIFGRVWDTSAISAAGAKSAAWSGGTFAGATWAGTSWNGNKFATATWTNKNWGNVAWASVPMTSNSWDGMRWSGMRWSGMRWSSSNWSGNAWSSAAWG